MNNSGKPVPSNLEKMRAIAQGVVGEPIDFYDTAIAFASKSDDALNQSAWLFGLMNHHWLVGLGSKLGLAAIRLRLPFVESAVKQTIFRQFCGGTTLLESKPAIDALFRQGAVSVLDYGAEAKETEADFNHTMNETMRAIDFASQGEAMPIVSSKITGLARFGLLEDIQAELPFTPETREEYKSVLKRMDAISAHAAKRGVSVFFDAEESWIQQTIDHLVMTVMRRYNKERAVVYNTFQLYRTDRLAYLFESFDEAQKGGFVLGAKLVRGAYMEKERERAAEMGYPSPIHPSKEATDDAFDTGIRFCLDNWERIAFCNASHNVESARKQVEYIRAKGLDPKHPHLMFCQLYGMSDNLTFNLAHHGFYVGKYLVYGSVREVVPYLIRRAEENSSVTGDMSREHQLVLKEIKRRKSAQG